MHIQANSALKLLYCASLISIIFPTALVGASGWIGLATGGSWFGAGAMTGVALSALLILYRVFRVALVKPTLDAYVTSTLVRVFRWIGIALMALGLISALAMFFTRPLALGLFGKPGDGGIAFFIVQIALFFLASASTAGLTLFELSRLLGFETLMQRQQKSAARA